MKTRHWLPVAVSMLTIFPVSSRAQPYEIPWYTTEPGIAIAAGTYVIFGIAGQPDAGQVTAGTYTIQGGYVGEGVVTTIVDDREPPVTPENYRLYPGIPNPFNPATSIGFDLPEAGHVKMTVYDVGGRLVRRLVDRSLPAGHHVAQWNGIDGSGGNAVSGVYFVVLEAGVFRQSTKIVLLK